MLLNFDNTVLDCISQNTNRDVKPATKVKSAKTLFKQHCIRCHGADGRGETVAGEIAGAQDFTDSEWQNRVEDQRIVISITDGRGQMPSFGKKFSKEQIKLLAVYVRTFKE
jgi:cbb3-type cytochrome c oxidase subunit III